MMETLNDKIADIFNTKDIENIQKILSYNNLGGKIMDVLRLVEKQNIALDKAEQQLFGFYYCKSNRNNIIGLITAMGLKQSEWLELKKQYGLAYLNEEDELEIENYFLTNTK